MFNFQSYSYQVAEWQMHAAKIVLTLASGLRQSYASFRESCTGCMKTGVDKWFQRGILQLVENNHRKCWDFYWPAVVYPISFWAIHRQCFKFSLIWMFHISSLFLYCSTFDIWADRKITGSRGFQLMDRSVKLIGIWNIFNLNCRWEAAANNGFGMHDYNLAI